MHFAVPSVMNAVPLSCEASVTPLDSSPIRSPQAAHTSLLEYFRGKNIAEIGTRRGDGMACYSQVARSALAIELFFGWPQLAAVAASERILNARIECMRSHSQSARTILKAIDAGGNDTGGLQMLQLTSLRNPIQLI